MCVILFSYRVDEKFPLVLLANRDERYDRPAARAAFWADFPEVFGGRDLTAGGTWLAVGEGGRFAAVTNYREPLVPATGKRSRGTLVPEFLTSAESPNSYLKSVAERAHEFAGFNIIAGRIDGTADEICWFANRGDAGVVTLKPGIYGVSNHLLNTPWPKVSRGRDFLMRNRGRPSPERSFDFLADRSEAPDDQLPETGLELDAERRLSAIFIASPNYGTRCSTYLKLDRSGRFDMEERDQREPNGAARTGRSR